MSETEILETHRDDLALALCHVTAVAVHTLGLDRFEELCFSTRAETEGLAKGAKFWIKETFKGMRDG